MKQQKKIVFIVNPISGDTQKLRIVEQIHAVLNDKIDYDIQYTEYARHAIDLAKKAIQNKADAVIAVGGDGTVNEVGSALINSEAALGDVPSGSGNGFARHLKIPMDIKSALHRILEFNIIQIDTGSVNSKPFLATTGTGFDSHVAHKFADFGKRGILSYMQISTSEYLNYKAKDYEIYVDNQKIENKAFLIVVANSSQYGNNAWIAPNASLTDGLFNIGILEKFPAALLPDILLRLFNKTIEKSKYYHSITGKEVIIKQVDDYHIDGEPMKGGLDLHIQMNPKSLNVIS